MTAPEETVRHALAQQGDDDAHDRGLIRERLDWTRAERLDANTAFLRFYLSVRPDGPSSVMNRRDPTPAGRLRRFGSASLPFFC